MMRQIVLRLDPQKLIVTTGDHGGYKTGICVLCDQQGWLDGNGLGYPAVHSPEILANRIIHEINCPLGRRLDKAGGLK